MGEMVKSNMWGEGIRAQLLSVVLLIFFSIVLVNALNFDSFHENYEYIISRFGLWSLFIILFITAILYSAAIPSTVLGAASGAALGFILGTLVYISASFIGSLLVYMISRTILQNQLHKRIRKNKYLGKMESVMEKEGIRFLFMIRFIPVHASFVNAFFGISGIKPRKFLISCLFLLPELILHVYTGYCAVSIGTMQFRDLELPDIARIVSLVIAIGAIIYLGWIAGKVQKEIK